MEIFTPLPSDWAIKPRRLELGLIATRMLFSDSHEEPVACVCNYSNKPYRFKADSFLGLADPVVHIQGTGGEAVNSCLGDSNELVVSVQMGESTEPESSDLRPEWCQTRRLNFAL